MSNLNTFLCWIWGRTLLNHIFTVSPLCTYSEHLRSHDSCKSAASPETLKCYWRSSASLNRPYHKFTFGENDPMLLPVYEVVPGSHHVRIIVKVTSCVFVAQYHPVEIILVANSGVDVFRYWGRFHVSKQVATVSPHFAVGISPQSRKHSKITISWIAVGGITSARVIFLVEIGTHSYW